MADQSVRQADVQWFDFIDNDSNGRVSAPELQRALSRGGLHFSLQTVARMIGMYDRSGAGSVDFEEFNQLHVFIVQTQNDFRMIDQNKDGLLSKPEVSQALSQAGFSISEPAFEALFTAYDPDRNQHLSMTEFLGLTLFLRSASGMFQGFAQGANKITLTFDQFVYAACHCR